MSDSDMGRDVSGGSVAHDAEGGGATAGRGQLTPARLRIIGLRRIIRLRRKLRRARRRSTHTSALGLVALFALGAAVAAGCGWEGTAHSVRFNRWHDERRFSRLPPLPFDARKSVRADYRDWNAEQEDLPPDDTNKRATALWVRAGEAATQSDFIQLRKYLNEYLGITSEAVCGSYTDPSVNCRLRLNSARDRLDALDALGRGANVRAVSAYIAARRVYDEWLVVRDKDEAVKRNPNWKFDTQRESQGGGQVAEKVKQETPPSGAEDTFAPVEAALAAVPRDANVEDNVAYLRAAALFESGEWSTSIEAFERLAARYPKSEKREASLFNVGMLWMKESEAGSGSSTPRRRRLAQTARTKLGLKLTLRSRACCASTRGAATRATRAAGSPSCMCASASAPRGSSSTTVCSPMRATHGRATRLCARFVSCATARPMRRWGASNRCSKTSRVPRSPTPTTKSTTRRSAQASTLKCPRRRTLTRGAWSTARAARASTTAGLKRRATGRSAPPCARASRASRPSPRT